MSFRSKWANWAPPQVVERAPDQENYDPASFDPDDRRTWPEYLHRLEAISFEQFGPEAARRQVRAEIAFLRRVEGPIKITRAGNQAWMMELVEGTED